jgi:hypothetical protein
MGKTLCFLIDLVLSIAVFAGVYADVGHWYTAFVVAMLFLILSNHLGKQHDA